MVRQSKSNGSSKQSTSTSARNDKKSESSAGFDHDEMGMTQERQRVIQASLFKMLGQADSATPGGDSDLPKISNAAGAVTAGES